MTKKKGIFGKNEEEPRKEDEIEVMADEEEEYEGELALDVYQDKNNVYVKSTMAGVKPEDIDIALNGDMLTVKGSRKLEEEIREEDYFYQECYWGAFSRSVILPVEVEIDKVNAKLKDGILTIKLPKSKKNRAKKISVKMDTGE